MEENKETKKSGVSTYEIALKGNGLNLIRQISQTIAEKCISLIMRKTGSSKESDQGPSAETYEITLNGEGFNLARSLTEPLAKKILSLVMNGSSTREHEPGDNRSSKGNYFETSIKPVIDEVINGLTQLEAMGSEHLIPHAKTFLEDLADALGQPEAGRRGHRRHRRRRSGHGHRYHGYRHDTNRNRDDNRERGMSIGEYIEEVQAERNPEIIVAVAAFLKKNLDWNIFSSPDIKSQLRNIGVKVPKNLSRDLKWTEDIGWIERDEDSPGYYRLTELGLMALEEKFSTEVKKGTTKKTTETELDPEKVYEEIIKGTEDKI